MKHKEWRTVSSLLVNAVIDFVASLIFLGLGATLFYFAPVDNPVGAWISGLIVIDVLFLWQTLTFSKG